MIATHLAVDERVVRCRGMSCDWLRLVSVHQSGSNSGSDTRTRTQADTRDRPAQPRGQAPGWVIRGLVSSLVHPPFFVFFLLLLFSWSSFFLHMIFFYLLNAKRCSVLKLTCSSQVEFYILVALATGRALSKPSNTASWLRPGRPCQHWEKIQLVLVPHTWSEIRSRKKMH